MYGTTDFCVMKYEAKTGSATVAATTQAAGAPTVNITQDNARTACTNNGAGYGLINNAEWMTIARNIEGQASNWRNGVIGSVDASPTNGGLYRGHSDSSPNNSLAANTNDSQGYEGTGNANETPVSRERRTHTLSNGEVIWDLSGNVWEWTNDTIMGANKPTGSSNEFTSMTGYGSLSYDLIRPSNPAWNSSQTMGIFFAFSSLTGGPYAFVRGSFWYNDQIAGIFTLFTDFTPSNTDPRIGFRCVVH
jgi:formylglycine-generating enzyme required for sulfatase activity